MKKIAIILANDFEEVEAITVIDVLRRAASLFNEIESVDTFSLNNNIDIIGSHQISIKADKKFIEFNENEYDMIFLPGGPGHKNYYKSEKLKEIILNFNKQKKFISAICAAPQFLGSLGILENKKVTSYPNCTDHLEKSIYIDNTFAIKDDNIITGVSLGTSLPFALFLAKIYLNEKQHVKLVDSLVIFI